VSGGNPGICGGRRCNAGLNHGNPCEVNSECPFGACGVPGKTTQPNECDDNVCTPNTPPDGDSSNEGVCAAGPLERFCNIETFRGCDDNSDCTVPSDFCGDGRFRECFTDNGVTSTQCFGGGNNNAPCTVNSQCPGGFCGGASVSVGGVSDPPCGNTAHPIVGGFFCIAPTSSPSVNSVTGLPGLGRVTIPTEAEFN
jgi:hypothetical protein